MMELSISIILPVYNADRFIFDCISSVLHQSFQDYELILINDGSTDLSDEIIQKFLPNDKIKYIKQENHGVSYTRNLGIELAKGEYIVFLDADDLLPEHSLKERMENVVNFDMSLASYKIIDSQNNYVRSMPKVDNCVLNRNKAITTLFKIEQIGYQGYLWNKIFKTSIIKYNSITFDNNIYYGEDRLFVAEYLLHCNEIYITDKCVYFYRLHDSGAMTAMQQLDDNSYDKLITEFVGFKKLEELLLGEDRDLFELCLSAKMCTITTLLRRVNEKSGKFKKYCLNQGLECLPQYLKCSNKNVSVLRKLKTIIHLVFDI